MPEDASVWLARAIAARQMQEMESALEAIGRAAALAPTDAQVALGHAQLRFEAGLPATVLFQRAAALAPDRPEVQRSLALAMAAEGDAAGGEALLDAVVTANPLWLDGHRALANLRTAAGQPDFARSLARAAAAHPGQPGLRHAWFHTLCTARRWDEARQVLDQAEHDLGESRATRLARAYWRSESGEGANDPALFDLLEDEQDTGLDLARVRHFLRGGQVQRARDVALRHRGQPTMGVFWPYLSLAWRLLGDAQAHWLDRDMAFVCAYDVGLTAADLADLATLLRTLHTAQAPWHEQSVRGGTQTERPLLLRLDPVIRKTRIAIEAVANRYIAALPPPDPQHPLLAAPREQFLFAGSWSVRLRPNGFHAAHTHPMGWISSALYVTVPPERQRGPAPAGHLQFGTPPPELGLALSSYGAVEPAPGTLALFPSTMWHGTAPFADGERMTIAFDVIPAAARRSPRSSGPAQSPR
ncbi:putative 2OG-Fe(II) oxygenase [Novosphingobium cyanobacteriorum]|uniref:2OG-Fe(II) oxygenase n=1 Tax=Novosphingobium cyanobacteriorum TaxID=3024215 RepID=A0ABT6CMH2_9SPHN|nr:putative 2OG-Fe(II) oxygenase [Novosphingobium cyanobacteriorum]MDF8335121.1 putative 2OG-Fe(II) oxygenase [Novosphingobium cyanobacteriorum]